jgi:hypothetical protein
MTEVQPPVTITHLVHLQRPIHHLVRPAQMNVSDDILVVIFEFCLPRWNDVETTNWLTFSQVCRHWRTVSLAHSSLWTRFDVRHLELSMMVRRESFPTYWKYENRGNRSCDGPLPTLSSIAAWIFVMSSPETTPFTRSLPWTNS